MGKTKKEHEAGMLKVIKEHKLICFAHVFGYYTGISRQRAYQLGIDKLDTIKEALDENRVRTTSTLFNKWKDSDNPTLQLAAYRLACTDEERIKLNQQYIESKHAVKVQGDARTPQEISAEIDRLKVLQQIAKDQ